MSVQHSEVRGSSLWDLQDCPGDIQVVPRHSETERQQATVVGGLQQMHVTRQSIYYVGVLLL